MEREISWPGWEITRRIGQGGFGAVYEIQRDFFGRTERAALKVISIPQSDDEIRQLYEEGYDNDSITTHFRGYLEELVQEYSLMLELKGHTNIVYCDELRYIQHDDGIGWDIYIKMELLTPLKAYIGKEYNEQQTIRLGIDMCQALILCQNQNIVHRDIKPENIFVSKNGDYKLGDFGVAKVSEKTASGTKIGTYEYMSPEVYRGLAYGNGADIYSLGLVLYWMMNNRRTPFLNATGQIPTMAEKEAARNRRFGGEPLPRPRNGSAALQQVVLKACAYNPAVRYTSAAQLLEDLQRILQWQENSVQERTVRKTRQTEFENISALTGEDNGPVSSGANVVRETRYGQNVGSAYRQVGTGVREQIGSYQGASSVNENQRNAQVWQTGVGTKKKSKKGWIIALVIFLSIVLVGVAIGLGKFVIDSISGLGGSTQQDDPGKNPEDESGKKTATGEEHLAQTLTYDDGSYMELYCDENDREVRRVYYAADGTLLFQMFATYDENGKMLSHEVYDGSGALFGARERTYDSNGKVLTDTRMTADGTVYRHVEYQRTADGELELETAYDGNGNLVTQKEYIYSTYGISEVYTYDAEGWVINREERSYHSKGVLSQVVMYSEYGYTDISYYNEDGIYCGSEHFNENDKLMYKTVIEFDEDGEPIGYYDDSYYGQVPESVHGVYEEDISGNTYRAREYRDDVQVGVVEWVDGIDGAALLYFYKDEYSYSVNCYNGVGQEISNSYYEDGALVFRYERTYDNAGRQIEVREYDETDSLSSRETWEYTARGAEARSVRYYPDGSVWSTTEYNYGAQGVLESIEERNYYDTNSSYYLYDANWNILTSIYYDENGAFSSMTEYDRDANGYALRCRHYYEEGVLDSQEVYTNDSEGNLIRTDYYDAEGNLERSYTVTYNEDGDPAKETWYDNRGKITSWTESFYDDSGKKEKKVEYNADGTQNGWWEYFYDENGFFEDSVWHDAE